MKWFTLFRVAIMATVTWSESAAASPCVMVLADTASGESASGPSQNSSYTDAVRRIMGELEMRRFLVEVHPAPLQLESDQARRLTEQSGCSALVSLSSEQSTTVASVWVIHPADDRFVADQMGREPVLPADILAIRVAEFIQAGLLQLDLPRPQVEKKGESSPEAKVEVSPQLKDAPEKRAEARASGRKPDPKPRSKQARALAPAVIREAGKESLELRAGIAAGALLGIGDFDPTPALSASLGATLPSHFEVAALGILSMDTSVEVEAQRVRAGQQVVLGLLGYRFGRGLGWEPFVHADLGVYRLIATGQQTESVRGSKDAVIVIAAGLGGGVSRSMGRHLSLFFDASLLFTSLRPVVTFPTGATRSSPWPLLTPRAGVELAW